MNPHIKNAIKIVIDAKNSGSKLCTSLECDYEIGKEEYPYLRIQRQTIEIYNLVRSTKGKRFKAQTFVENIKKLHKNMGGFEVLIAAIRLFYPTAFQIWLNGKE